MNFAMMLGLFDPLLNWIRSFSQMTKGIIILVALMLSFFCLAKTFNVGKDHAEHPFRWLMFGLSLVFMGVAILVGVV